MSETPPPPFKVPTAMRFVGGIFGLVFAAIGVTVILNMWFGEMGEGAPVFFKLFASFIATAFIAMGGTLAYGSFFGSGHMMDPNHLAVHARQMTEKHTASARPTAAGPGNYVCPHCGGKLTRADVSPLGDVKCTFCGAWFNVHGKS